MKLFLFCLYVSDSHAILVLLRSSQIDKLVTFLFHQLLCRHSYRHNVIVVYHIIYFYFYLLLFIIKNMKHWKHKISFAIHSCCHNNCYAIEIVGHREVHHLSSQFLVCLLLYFNLKFINYAFFSGHSRQQ